MGEALPAKYHERLLGSGDVGTVFKCVSPMHKSLSIFSLSIILHFETCKSVIIYNFLNIL